MNITLDGFVSGSDSELDWHFQSWNEEMAQSLTQQLNKADTILLGRITYKAMAAYWPTSTCDPFFPREDIAFAEMMNGYSKIVFSKTLKKTHWNNSRLIKGNIEYEIAQLKHQQGKDIIIYGSNQLVSALVEFGLIDECQVWIHPVILGNGKPLFKNLHEKLDMKLLKIKTFRSGVVMLNYGIR
jgi:dihydrofolate reductase